MSSSGANPAMETVAALMARATVRLCTSRSAKHCRLTDRQADGVQLPARIPSEQNRNHRQSGVPLSAHYFARAFRPSCPPAGDVLGFDPQ